MKKLIIILVLILLPIKVHAYQTSATSAILMDTDTNRILYAKNIHNIRSVASISKIMTAILAVESGKLENDIVIGTEINGAYGSGIYIKEGEELKLKDLVYGLMLRSGNDAALAIAHHVGGSIDEFIKKMNEKAKEIGMKNTTFHNPSGLDEEKGNLSTAYDMAILTNYAMKNDTYKQIVGTKKYKLKTNLNYYEWTNKNKLLFSNKYITGGKTGFTEIAKRTLVSTASKEDINLTVVTLNDGNDWEDHQSLYQEAFEEFEKLHILKTGNVEIIGENFYKNRTFYIKQNFDYLLNKSEKENIVLKFKLEKKDNYKNGDKIGSVIVKLGDKEIHTQDVFVEIKKKKINVWDLILGWFK